MYSPIRHWALVGEIVQVNYFIRPRVTIQTQFKEEVLVNFHLDEPKPTFFEWPDLKPGSTLVILYAVNRTFVDLNSGVRQESPRTVMVFPTTLPKLTDEFEKYVAFEKHQMKKCFECGALETEECKIMKCTRCKKAFYCGRGCQVFSWKCAHKNLCTHAQMLANLASLDFSQFNGFANWNFPTLEPQTPEERMAKAEMAQREALYRMGAVIDSMPKRFAGFLSLIKDRYVVSEPLTKNFFAGNTLIATLNQGSLPTSVGETFLFKSFKEYLNRLSQEPDLRHFVVDLKSHASPRERSIVHYVSDLMLSALFFAIPMWQHEGCVGGISWSFESHNPLSSKMEAYKNGAVWETTVGDDCDSLLIKNRISQTCTFMSDDMRVVAEIGEHIARNNPKDMVVRVIRATANETWGDSIHDIATKHDTPKNMFTLWIREDVPMCGRFNPPNPRLSLVEQLLDRSAFSLIDSMLESLGVPEENIIRSTSNNPKGESETGGSGDGHGKHLCSSCGQLKKKQLFSKTQLRKYGKQARCKDCILYS